MKVGDYIKDRNCTLIQGKIIKEGKIGLDSDCYYMRRPDNKVLFIRKKDAVKLGGDWPEDTP